MRYKHLKNTFEIVILAILISACGAKQEPPLPILGERDVITVEENGVKKVDTIYHTIAPFEFVNQDSSIVTNHTFDGKIYVADFFFTSCRSICPKMKTQMLRVYDSIQNQNDVLILSHTIDPEYDTVGLLRDFANRLGVTSNKWHFVTGNKDSIYSIAQTSYFVTAMEDKSEPDGFVHNGAFLLIDKARRIRGIYDGTKEPDVNRLLADLARLRKEYAQ
jgi:protein SCO1